MHRTVWIAALAAAVLAGIFTGALHWLAAIWIALLAALAIAYTRVRDSRHRLTSASGKRSQASSFFIYALAMGLALLPGFHRVVLVAARGAVRRRRAVRHLGRLPQGRHRHHHSRAHQSVARAFLARARPRAGARVAGLRHHRGRWAWPSCSLMGYTSVRTQVDRAVPALRAGQSLLHLPVGGSVLPRLRAARAVAHRLRTARSPRASR